jgi:glycosyltransferase involved in cell wall biosynthesis
MHVGLVIYGSLTTVSGGYLYDRQLVEHLTARGDTVEVISLPWRSYGRHLLDNASRPLAGRLRHGRYDVLLQDELNHPSLVWLNRRLRGRVAYPIVAIVHHLRGDEARPAWQNSLYRRLERAYLGSVDGFIFNSQTTRASVERLIGGQRPAVVAVPGGDRLGPRPTAGVIEARARREGPLRLLFVGNVIPRKGLPTLLAALADLPTGTARLDVYGSLTADPRHAARVRQQIEATGLTGRVTLHGARPDADLAAAMAASHALVVPSSYEGYGIVYIEAMGFGLPSIAGSLGAAAEIVSDGLNGWLVAPGDIATLRARLHALASDRPRLLAMSLAAHRRFAAHPTWQAGMSRARAFLLRLTGAA